MKRNLTVVIADDDYLVLKDLKSIINWNELGFSVTSYFQDGESVLSYIDKNPVDLLITDICMMKMNGLDVIEQAHKKYPDMKFLIISSYNDFEYAKRAIATGVSDYLLKNEISSSTLTQKLLDIKSSFTKESYQLSASNEQQLTTYFNSNEDWDNFPLTDTLHSQKYYFCFIAPHALFSRETVSVSNEHYFRMYNYKTRIYELSMEYCAAPIVCHYKDGLIIGFSDEISKDKIRLLMNRFISRISFLPNGIQCSLCAFFSCTKKTIPEFKRYLTSLLPMMRYHMLFSDSKPLDFQQLEKKTHLAVKNRFSFYSLIFDELHQEDNIMAVKIYLEECFQCNDYDALQKFYQSFCEHIELITKNRFSLPQTFYADTKEHFQKWIFNTLHECIQKMSIGFEKNYSPVIDNAIRFMHQNYSNHNLNSADIADYVGLSVNRLGVLIKKETGKTINEYLSEIRIEKAIEFLEKTNMRIYEISNKCGYKSSQYFSQIIVQRTGKRPIDFRKGIL